MQIGLHLDYKAGRYKTDDIYIDIDIDIDIDRDIDIDLVLEHLAV